MTKRDRRWQTSDSQIPKVKYERSRDDDHMIDVKIIRRDRYNQKMQNRWRDLRRKDYLD